MGFWDKYYLPTTGPIFQIMGLVCVDAMKHKIFDRDHLHKNSLTIVTYLAEMYTSNRQHQWHDKFLLIKKNYAVIAT